MLLTSVSASLGIFFVFIAGLNTWMGFQISLKKVNHQRYIRFHRFTGYVFLALYLVMMYFMLLKLKDYPDELPSRPLFHMVLGFSIMPLLFIKIVIARYYKSYYSYLPPLGLLIFSMCYKDLFLNL